MASNLFQNPTRKSVFIVGFMTILGIGMLLFAVTDGFQTPLFRSENLLVILLSLLNILMFSGMLRNYFRQKK